MSQRSGVVAAIPLTVTGVGVTYMLVIGIIYTQVIAGQVSVVGDNMYGRNAIGEEVMEAPCATRSRAVFYNSSVVAGDFRCLNPVGVTYLQFDVFDGGTTTWSITRLEDGTTEVSATVQGTAQLTHSYPVKIYDTATNTYRNTTLRVGWLD